MVKRTSKTEDVRSSSLDSFVSVQKETLASSKESKSEGLPEEIETKISELSSGGLDFNAERRFNRYEMYEPGDTFDSRLRGWLRNFDANDQSLALDLVNHIRYISRNELRTLSEFVLDFAATVTWEYIIRSYKVKYEPKGKSWYDSFAEEMKQNIFAAVSDDTGFDYFRRLGRRRFPQLEKDNFIEYYKMAKEDIKEVVEEIGGRIKRVFLLDQMCGSGTTALRFTEETSGPKSEGKLRTFVRRWKGEIAGSEVYYIPLIASSFAKSVLEENLNKLAGSSDEVGYTNIKSSPLLIVPPSEWLVSITDGKLSIKEPALSLSKRYYNKFEEDRHTIKGGGCLFGVGNMGLTLVIGTNCPNNSLYIIWHDHEGWYPLFPRVAHHRHETPFQGDENAQKKKLEENCQRQASLSVLSNISMVELKNDTSNFDFVASVDSTHSKYKELRELVGPNWISIETSFSEKRLKEAIEKIKKTNKKDTTAIELYADSNEQTMPPSKSSIEDKDLADILPTTNEIEINWKPKLIIPFLSPLGPIFSQHSKEVIKENFVIPAIMFPLSGRPSLDKLLAIHSKYIDSCQTRTERFLYVPAESPAITFYRVVEVIESWHSTKNIEYENMCLIPACDSTSILAVTALAGIYSAKIHVPKISREVPYIKGNNLILMKQHHEKMKK